ncbi:MAG: FecR domain-containing protein [Parvibaculaceae bacterium]|nr:FecR domain-containing protein [Parvibaculaceae bacterium]
MAWLSLLSSGTATTADGEALKRWCREDPSHAEAYAKAARMWEMLAPVAAQAPGPDMATATVMPRQMGRRAFLGGAIAASAACAAYVVIHPPLDIWPSLAELGADVRTATGERRRIDVAQDVEVDLNTRSSLALPAASDGSRHIELISGEAIITAGPKAAEACIVMAGEGRIFAHDARVDVRHDGARIRVVCLDGQVRVEHQAQAVTLAAREQVVYDGGGFQGAGTADPSVVAAWQQGRLIFRRQPLSQVIDEVNRYRPGRIVLLDSSLGRRLIDASFHLDRLENVIVYLRQAFDARITALPGGVILVG